MRRRVLFVDDEPSIRGIYNMLGEFLGDQYSISTVAGGEEAQLKLADTPADVVVSDLVMPGISGAELLLDVSKRYPCSGRIAVSGFADQITMAKCLTVAHRYFAKPFHPVALTKAIEELHGTQSSATGQLRKLVGGIQSLPIPSETYLQLTKALNSQSISLDNIAALVEKDPSLCSKLLQAANSAMFGSRQRCIRIADAIQTLGLEAIRMLLLSIQVFDLCPGKRFRPFLDALWKHSLEIAQTSKRFAELQELPSSETEQAFLGGLLHDLGKVVLAASSSETYGALIDKLAPDTPAFREAEVTAFGGSHAIAGSYLLKLWGLPEQIVRVVERHHHPFEEIQQDKLLLSVQAAHQLPGSSSAAEFARWREKKRDGGSSTQKSGQAGPPQIGAALVASSDLFECERLAATLRANGFLTFTADSKKEAFKMLHDLTFQIAIVDEALLPDPASPPDAALRQLQQVNGTARFVLLRRSAIVPAAGEMPQSQSGHAETLPFGAGAHELFRQFKRF